MLYHASNWAVVFVVLVVVTWSGGTGCCHKYFVIWWSWMENYDNSWTKASELADDLLQRQQQKENLIKSRERTLNLIKSSLDILVAAGLLKLAPRTITPRITGALGFITSAISCYQLLPTPPKAKSSWASAGRSLLVLLPWFLTGKFVYPGI